MVQFLCGILLNISHMHDYNQMVFLIGSSASNFSEKFLMGTKFSWQSCLFSLITNDETTNT